MHRLTIGMTAPAFSIMKKRGFEYSEGDYRLLNAIINHDIILTDKILEYYNSSGIDSEIIKALIESKGNTYKIRFFKPKEVFDNGIEELIYCVSKCEMKILIGEKKDVFPHDYRNINLTETSKVKKGEFTPISKYIYPVNLHIDSHCTCESISKWFGVLFKGEKQIDIQDKYILNPYGIKSLKNYYLPYIDKSTKINIYTTITKEFKEPDLVKAAQSPIFDGYNINIYQCSKMKHDRYIELDGIRIKIGAGLDIFGDDSMIREEKECDIDVILIDNSKRLSIPKVTKVLR